MLKILGIDFGELWETRLKEFSWLFLRVSMALLMLNHGFDKFYNFQNIAPHFYNFLGLGSALSLALVVLTEFFGSLALLFGLLTRWASFGLTFTMLVAAFGAHGSDPFSKQELAIVYACVYLSIALFGAGKYSLDAHIKSPA